MPTKLKHSADTNAEADSILGRILDSAELVLRREGYAGFSTRRVAQEAEIALGNLTYHFPTKSGLVRALIDRLMAKYLAQFQATLRPDGNGLESLVRSLMAESVNHEAMSLFREIWVMALHDTAVRDSIDDFYDELILKATQTLTAAYPNAEPDAIKDLVHLIAVASEGSTVIYGTRRARSTSHQKLVELAVRLVKTEVARIGAGSSDCSAD